MSAFQFPFALDSLRSPVLAAAEHWALDTCKHFFKGSEEEDKNMDLMLKWRVTFSESMPHLKSMLASKPLVAGHSGSNGLTDALVNVRGLIAKMEAGPLHLHFLIFLRSVSLVGPCRLTADNLVWCWTDVLRCQYTILTPLTADCSAPVDG